MRVLIAEDNRVLADVLRFNLQRAGFVVTVALNGTLALDRLRSETFDLLITDYQMPECNGEQLCQAIREELYLNELPILMCSAKGLELDVDLLMSRYGVTKIIYKPFSMREIVSLASGLIMSQNPSHTV